MTKDSIALFIDADNAPASTIEMVQPFFAHSSAERKYHQCELNPKL